MKTYRILLLLVVTALLAYVAKGDTLTQTFTLPELNLLEGGSAPLDLQRFDPNLGTLTDVRITYESFRLQTIFRVGNDQDYMISSYATGATCVPWLYDGAGTWIPALSFTQSMIELACGGGRPYFAPHSAHLFNATWNSGYFCHVPKKFDQGGGEGRLR